MVVAQKKQPIVHTCKGYYGWKSESLQVRGVDVLSEVLVSIDQEILNTRKVNSKSTQQYTEDMEERCKNYLLKVPE